MVATKYKTAEQALSQTALSTLSEMKVDEFVAHLKQRGIASLDDLAKASIGAARSAIGGGLTSIDPEDFPICYKFTVRPTFDHAKDLGAVLDRVKNAQYGR